VPINTKSTQVPGQLKVDGWATPAHSFEKRGKRKKGIEDRGNAGSLPMELCNGMMGSPAKPCMVDLTKKS